MNEAKIHPELYGLVELNQEGTVLYSRLDGAGANLGEHRRYGDEQGRRLIGRALKAE